MPKKSHRKRLEEIDDSVTKKTQKNHKLQGGSEYKSYSTLCRRLFLLEPSALTHTQVNALQQLANTVK